MKQIYFDKKKGEAKLKAENLDDLWYLSTIIDENDLVKGKTVRKIRIGTQDQRARTVVKKAVFLKIKVEKVEFSQNSDVLRISGIIVEGPDDIQKGEHHTFNVEENSIITIIKEKWLKFQLDKLNEATFEKGPKILVCIMDRELACFAITKKQSYQYLSEISGDVQKKADKDKKESKFYEEIIQILEKYNDKYKPDNIIIASPAFWKEELSKKICDEDLKKKVVLATCSSADKTALNEILKRNELRQILKQDRVAREVNMVEELLIEISKNNLAVYGLDDTENAVNIGAVKTLLVSDSFIQKMRQENNYKKLEAIMKTAESTRAEVHIISSKHEAGNKLDGLGGIGAILRYKLNY